MTVTAVPLITRSSMTEAPVTLAPFAPQVAVAVLLSVVDVKATRFVRVRFRPAALATEVAVPPEP